MKDYEFSNNWKYWVPIIHNQIRNDFDVSRLNVTNVQEVYSKLNFPKLPYLEAGYNKRVLVIMENGYGDDIWFYRFFLQLKDKINFTAFISPKTAPLYTEVNIITELTGEYDYWMWSFDFLLFYPKVFMTEGYLSIPPILTKNKTRIGFALGNDDTIASMNYRGINSDLVKQFNAETYNFSNIENTAYSHNIFNKFKDFRDTARWIQSMDIMICTDNCILHLSGALGKKTYGIFKEHNEWIWDDLPNSSLWYDSITVCSEDNLKMIIDEVKELEE